MYATRPVANKKGGRARRSPTRAADSAARAAQPRSSQPEPPLLPVCSTRISPLHLVNYEPLILRPQQPSYAVGGASGPDELGRGAGE